MEAKRMPDGENSSSVARNKNIENPKKMHTESGKPQFSNAKTD